MASTLVDLVIMTPSSAFGTASTIPLGSATSVNNVLYLSFAGAGATGGQQVSYSILDSSASEIGTATYLSSNNTLTTRTPTKSTNANAAINASSAALILGTVRGEDLNSFIVAGQLLGTATNDSANAGNVGEYSITKLLKASAISISSSAVVNITSVSLTAGDWSVQGVGGFTGTSASPVCVVCINNSSNALAGLDSGQQTGGVSCNLSTGLDLTVPTPMTRISLSATTTIFLNSYAAFGAGTVSGYGQIIVRRAR